MCCLTFFIPLFPSFPHGGQLELHDELLLLESAHQLNNDVYENLLNKFMNGNNDIIYLQLFDADNVVLKNTNKLKNLRVYNIYLVITNG